MRRALAGVLVVATLCFTTSSVAASPRSDLNGSVTVLAASSLTEAFGAMEKPFEHKYPDVDVEFSFGSSSTLATQVEQGAPADVFASADVDNMQRLRDGGNVEEGGSSVFARNRLVIAVAPGNPKHIKTVADTVADDLTLVLCAPEVPCGKYALEVYDKADVTLPDVPTGATAKDTLSKVALGEADAAVVYVTDVRAAKGEVDGVKIPRSDNVIARYPIAPLVDASNGAAAKAFVLFVTSNAGQKTLKRFGFLTP